ncbi:Hypothetical predicted protein [Pelobates cultripes]|uniref:Uncharacterized protein n=1 Tax=Pelobates cultripes TaxID=61616 RepID=A0AAD1QZY5_PELCU|nr:Hypothetical predicted protein [Pelobates cultripes]
MTLPQEAATADITQTCHPAKESKRQLEAQGGEKCRRAPYSGNSGIRSPSRWRTKMAEHHEAHRRVTASYPTESCAGLVPLLLQGQCPLYERNWLNVKLCFVASRATVPHLPVDSYQQCFPRFPALSLG